MSDRPPRDRPRAGRFPLRPIHGAVAALVTAVITVGAFERRPTLKDDFDPRRDWKRASRMLFSVELDPRRDMEDRSLSDRLRRAFQESGVSLPGNVVITPQHGGRLWRISDAGTGRTYFAERTPEALRIYLSTWETRLHIAYWEKWGSFEQEACQAMVDEFNRSQEEIFVHYINTSQVNRKAMLAIMGEDPPEVVGLWANDVPLFAEAGALVELDGLMASTDLRKERYIPNYLKLGMYRGKVRALPTTPASVGLYYNKTHFREMAEELRSAGLDPTRAPRTTDELDRYAEVLNIFDERGRPLRMGFLPTEPGWFNWTWGFYFGGRLFDEERGRITADDPRNVEAFLWCKRYAERYGREKMLQFRSGFGNFDSPQNAFIDGRVSMEVQGVWFSNFIRRHRPHMEFGVAPPPVAPGIAGPVSNVECDVIAIPRGCRHVEAAWRFVEFTQREGSAIICRLQGKHMPVKEPPPNFREGHPNLELEVFERLARSPHSFIQPRIRVWGEYRDELNKAFEHVWNWPVPEEELEGLELDARRLKVDEICRAKIKRTLGEVSERIQRQYDTRRRRDELREAR